MSDDENPKKPSTKTQTQGTAPTGEFMQSALRTNLFLRTLSLARLSLATSSRHASNKLSGLFSSDEAHRQRMKESLIEQSRAIAQELGQLKGSVMKVGQMLSVYGEHFLPREANEILKTLQCRAPSLDWNAVHPILLRELGPERLEELEIARQACAAASIGQVHTARNALTGEELALKIQYPGVDRAIQSDLRALRASLALAQVFSNLPHIDRVFLEVQDMLARELDYGIEADEMEKFRAWLADDPRYIVPVVVRRFSSTKILTTQYIEGHAIDSADVLALSQERRDRLARAMLDLYFHEIFEFGAVQTDPHFGNYRVVLDSDSASPETPDDRLALFDFGAVRHLDPGFTNKYRELTLQALACDRDGVIAAARSLGFLEPEDPIELLEAFAQFCFLMMEPFASPSAAALEENSYDWRASDLPKRLAAQLGEVIRSYRLRPPPREMIFLDRKTSGVFTALAVLGARIPGRPSLERAINREG